MLASGPLSVYCQSNTVSEQVKVELLFVILCVKACPHNQAWSGITHSHHLVHRKQAACVCPCVPMIHRIPPHAENHCKNLCISLSEMPVLSKTSPQVAVCLSKMAIRPSELFLCSFFTCCFPVFLHCQKTYQVFWLLRMLCEEYYWPELEELDQPIMHSSPELLVTYAISLNIDKNNCHHYNSIFGKVSLERMNCRRADWASSCDVWQGWSHLQKLHISSVGICREIWLKCKTWMRC